MTKELHKDSPGEITKVELAEADLIAEHITYQRARIDELRKEICEIEDDIKQIQQNCKHSIVESDPGGSVGFFQETCIACGNTNYY